MWLVGDFSSASMLKGVNKAQYTTQAGRVTTSVTGGFETTYTFFQPSGHKIFSRFQHSKTIFFDDIYVLHDPSVTLSFVTSYVSFEVWNFPDKFSRYSLFLFLLNLLFLGKCIENI